MGELLYPPSPRPVWLWELPFSQFFFFFFPAGSIFKVKQNSPRFLSFVDANALLLLFLIVVFCSCFTIEDFCFL